eukprot:281752-Pleurochrysis_carterae.AAC.1
MIGRSDVPAGRSIVRLIWVYKRKRNGPSKRASACEDVHRSKGSTTTKRSAPPCDRHLCASSPPWLPLKA